MKERKTTSAKRTAATLDQDSLEETGVSSDDRNRKPGHENTTWKKPRNPASTRCHCCVSPCKSSSSKRVRRLTQEEGDVQTIRIGNRATEPEDEGSLQDGGDSCLRQEGVQRMQLSQGREGLEPRDGDRRQEETEEQEEE